jgi:hypothetical protein
MEPRSLRQLCSTKNLRPSGSKKSKAWQEDSEASESRSSLSSKRREARKIGHTL